MSARVRTADIELRPYRASDRPWLRDVCYRTGYMGTPIDWQWYDFESFADMFSGYYTDAEPESALVAEIDGVGSGYLLGCIETERAWSPGTIAARHIVRRGLALRPGTAGVIWRTIGDAMADVALRRVDLRELEFADPRWPAHFHIDLLPDARGLGIGHQLVRRWLDSLRARSITGCHVQTFAENANALAFFESAGFRRLGPPLIVQGLRSPAGTRLHSQILVQDLE